VKRFDCETDHWAGVMVEYPDGEYVLYEDHLKEIGMTENAAPDQVAAGVKTAINPAAPPPPQPEPHHDCPCGEVPTDLIIAAPRGSKYGTVAGNCCAVWQMEFKVGYPKNEAEALKRGVDAWNAQPRG